jgi:hypothetical protein
MIEGARPEVELVCRCLTPSPDTAGRERLEALLAEDLDWEFLLEFAGHHGVLPLVHRRLVGEYGSRIDEAARSTLVENQQSRTARNLRMASALHDLLDRFEAANVRALPVKGPVLAEAAHGSLSRRAFNDLDIQVHEADVSRALDVMESMGYEWTVDAPRLDDAALLGGPLTPPLATEYSLWHPDQDVVVEVGWQFGSDPVSFKPGFETFWERRESTTVAGRPVPSLSPEDRLILLTYHCVKHGCALLKWVSDVAETVRATPDLDWPALFRRARDYGTARRLTVGLGVASTLLDVDVPGVSARLETDPAAADLVTEVHDRFVDRPLREFRSIDTVRYHRTASESLRARVSSWVFAMPLHPTLAEYRLVSLPSLLHPVYYLLRPLRLFVVYGLVNRLRPERT